MDFAGIYESFLMDAEYRRRLSEAIKGARGERSQRKFARDLGVSYPAVRSWEEGESLPGLENLELIAGSLGQTLEEFLAYLRDEDLEDIPRIRVAEDVLPLVNQLSKVELVRLTKMLIERLGEN